MSESSSPAKEHDSKANAIAIAVFSAALTLLAFLPSALIAVPVALLLRRALNRLEVGGIAIVSLLYLFFFSSIWVEHYIRWLGAVVGFDTGMGKFEAPWLAVVAMGVLFGCAGYFVLGTKALHWKIGAKVKAGYEDEILPSAKEKTRVKERIVSTPQSALLTDAGTHSAVAHEFGSRSFPIGVDKNGTPVEISEKEIRTHGLIFGSTGSGKALALDTPIPTPAGFTRMGQLVVGDEVFGDDGSPCRVVFVTETQLEHDCFEVVFSDGSVIVADAEHRWLTHTPTASRYGPTNASVVTTREILDTLKDHTGGVRHSVPATGALVLPEVELPLEPYALGCWLRLDSGSTLRVGRAGVVHELRARGWELRLQPGDTLVNEVVGFDQALAGLGTAAGRRIPAPYLRGSFEQRLALAEGLLADGNNRGGGSRTWSSTDAGLADDLGELLSGLGHVVRRSRAHDGRHVLRFSADLRTPATARRFITEVRPVASVPVRCIQVDSPTHLYLAGKAMIPTHNTETIKVVAGGLLDLGWSGMILDLKEDAQKGGLLDWCRDYSNAHAIGFQDFRISDPAPRYWFNALYGMGSDEARDTILASQTFEAAYYEALNTKQLGQLVSLLYAANEIDPVKYIAPTVYSIGKILSSPDLPAATREIVATVISNVPGFVKDDFDSLVRPDKAMVEAAGGLGARLTAMYETRAGRLALRGGGDRAAFDVTTPGLSYVGLDSMGKPEVTRLVSASVLRRMAVYAADRTSGSGGDISPRFLIVDEANFVNRRLLLELLSRARSAGIAVIVCTQGPTDWQATVQGEPDLTSLVQNTNVAIIMGQGERTNAELCADIIGRGDKTVLTHRLAEGSMMDAGTVGTTLDFLVSPDALRSLSIGEAVVRVGKPNEWRRWIQVKPREAGAIAGVRPAGRRHGGHGGH